MFRFATVSIAFALCAWAQQSEGDVLFAKQDWAGAAKEYRKVVDQQPADGRSWFRLGASLVRSGQGEEGRKALEKAIENKFQAPFAMAIIARTFAHEGDGAKSTEWLNRAGDAGFQQISFVQGDAEFEKVKSGAGFADAAAKVDHNAHPCKYKPENRQLDFWLGEWDVQVAGQTIASSRIETLLDGCGVQENWMPLGGPEGKSWNFFNPATGKWEQLWLSNGNVLKLEGSLQDGVMRMEGTRGGAMNKMSYTPLAGGRVRQVWDISTDGGKTWSSSFDGIYIPKKK
jgi:tetratricopeptide (TPR) repeat protein